MTHPKRRRLFIDARVQSALILRAALYWLFCLASIMMLVLCWRIVTGPARVFYTHFDDMWFHFGPALVASLLLLPLVLYDTLRFSHRFVGPLYRIRKGMRALARGEHVAPLRFRKGDFWHELAEEFNAVASLVQSDDREHAAATSPEGELPESDAEDDLIIAGRTA